MRPRWVTICVGGSGFQLTHSRGVRRVHIRRKQLRSDFNSRTHVECDISDTIPNVSGLDFNSRTHVECDANSEDQSATSFISTHALTWSATDGVVECDDYVKISTHALTWSATARRIHGAANREFQLTHSRGVRQFRHVLRTSPHTFQLTHSRGVRRAYLYPDLISIVDFNSRTHVECDIVPVFHVAQIFHFNSRTHVECDLTDTFRPQPCSRFQLTHSRGVRPTHAESSWNSWHRFQLTHSRGVRLLTVDYLWINQYFNSRTHVECDKKRK